jgi:hypothetical protein
MYNYDRRAGAIIAALINIQFLSHMVEEHARG